MPIRRIVLAGLLVPVAAMRSCDCGGGPAPSPAPSSPTTPGTTQAADNRAGTAAGGRAVEDVERTVVEIVSEQMGVDKGELTRDTHFIKDLSVDSLDTVELVMELEDEFSLSIPDADAQKILTVGQAIDYIMKRQLSAGPAAP